MSERRFQPSPVSTVITFVLFTVLIGLGIWQVQRLHWKEALLATIHTNMTQKAVPMPESFDDMHAWQYRRVTLAGSFDFTHEFLVKPRTLDGQSGYDMVVPFIRASGGTVLVDRGWISDALMERAQRPGQGMIQIEGVLRESKRPNSFTPDNNPAKLDWYWIDTAGMGEAANLKDVSPMVLYIADKTPGVYPVGGRVTVEIPNDHKQYAAFWFSMAFILLIVWYLSHLQRVPKLEEKHAGV
jgi:surfeit locus 1 family protein